MKKALVCILVTLICSYSCIAKPLDPNVIDINATWAFHADYDQFNNSDLGNLIKQQIVILGLDSHLKRFSDKFAYDPIEDVKAVTIYGQGEEREKAVAFVYADFDESVLLNLLEKDLTHEVTAYNGHQIHSFKGRDKMNFGLLYTPNTMILSTGLEAVKNAIDNLDAEDKSLNVALLDLLEYDVFPAIVRIASLNVADNLSPEHTCPVLKQTKNLSIFMGEDNGLFYLDLDLKCYNQEAALNIENMVRGIISFGLMANEKHPELAKIAQGVQVIRTDENINLYFEAEPEFIISTILEKCKKKMGCPIR